jgi:hypothetical protein
VSEPRTTRREDRRALVDAGHRYHAAKLAYEYTASGGNAGENEYRHARSEFLYLAECYAVGRRKASCEYGHQWAARSKKASI